ncbi:cytochrome c, partial [Pseudomonas sp.]|uniref:c-type cytochrome n=1 Tax=Pseudomonas sp. TaxID=306 RepID=UPI00338F1BB2
LLLALLLGGCDDMSRQAKTREYRPGPLLGNVQRDPPAGAVARGQLAEQALLEQRPYLDMALLARGQQRFEIYCAPCHGVDGQGGGIVVSRGFPRPPAFTETRLVQVPDSYLLTVIAKGHGQMFSYAARVAPADRWAIIAHLRALQLAQHLPLASLPPRQRQALQAHLP